MPDDDRIEIEGQGKHSQQPETVEAAVDLLVSRLSLRSRDLISRISEDSLLRLHCSLGLYVRDCLLQPKNERLLESCRIQSQDKYLHWEQAPMVIIRALWLRLQSVHKMRVLK